MKVTINNNDTHNLNKKWIRTTLLIFGIVVIFMGLAQLYFNAFRPEGNEKVAYTIGKSYVMNFILGFLSLLSYYLIKNSKPLKSN